MVRGEVELRQGGKWCAQGNALAQSGHSIAAAEKTFSPKGPICFWIGAFGQRE